MRERCRACGVAAPRPFHAQSTIPVNSCLLVDDRQTALDFPTGDLELAFCAACGFIQNRRFDPAAVTYSTDYEETQGFSGHFRRFVDELIDDQDSKHHLAGKTVLEIGCGKGEFLSRLVERTGARGVGIDPSFRPDRLAGGATDRPTFIQDWYGPAHADLAADFVCCRHTLEHIPDVLDFVRLVRRGIGDRPGVRILFEVPDTRRVLAELAFWDIYYEHCSYFTAGSLARLFARAGFVVDDVRTAYGDQYLLLEARPADGSSRPGKSVDDLAETAALVEQFASGLPRKLEALRAEVDAWRGAGRTVAIWGSGSKAVAYLTSLGLATEIAAVVDINPHKAGKFMAGTGHRIEQPEHLRELRPDVVVAMNPVYLAEIGQALGELGLAPELRALD